MDGTQEPFEAAPGQTARNWAIAAHLGPVAMTLLSAGALGWLAPLVVWLTQKEAHPFAAEHAKEALNFNITVLLFFVLTFPILFFFFCIGVPIWLLVWAVQIVLAILAAIAASDGKPYRYPFTLRLVS
jgi:uncharacterized Tic20 family protein